MLKTCDVVIYGNDVVAQTLALQLARASLQVAMVAAKDAPPPAPGLPAGLLSAAHQALLQSLECWPAEAVNTSILRWRLHDDRQACVELDARRMARQDLGCVVDLHALSQRLQQAIRQQDGIAYVQQPPAACLNVVCDDPEGLMLRKLGVSWQPAAHAEQALCVLRLKCEKPHHQELLQYSSSADGSLFFLPADGARGDEVILLWLAGQERMALLEHWEDELLAAQVAEISQHALGQLQPVGPRIVQSFRPGRAAHRIGPMPQQSAIFSQASFVLAGQAACSINPLVDLGLGLDDGAALARTLSQRESWRSIHDLKLLRGHARKRQAVAQHRLALDQGVQRLFAREDELSGQLRSFGLQLLDLSGPVKTGLARWLMHSA